MVDEIIDEDLILQTRFGNEHFLNVLLERYFKRRRQLAKCAAPTFSASINDYDLSSAFFVAFQNALSNYEFGRVRFETYFITCLGHELLHLKQEQQKRCYYEWSLDNSLPSSDGKLLLEDVVETPQEDPKLYFDYLERSKDLPFLEKKLDPTTKQIIRLKDEGFTYHEIGLILRLTIKQVRNRYDKFRKLVSDLFKEDFATCKRENTKV